MREPAVHCPPATETRSLSATGRPSSGCSASSADPPSARAADRRASAASAWASAPSRSIRSQALSAWFWRSAASRCAAVRSRDETSPWRRRSAISWPSRRVGSAVTAATASGVAAEDRGDDDEVTVRRPRVPEDRLHLERGSGDVLAQDVLELDRLGGRRDGRRVELGQLRVLVEDVVELALEPIELLVGQSKAGE